MDFNKKLITLLAIFCVVLSAGAVCAADVGGDGNLLGDQYQDDNGYAGSQYDDNNYADAQDNASDDGNTDGQIIDPDYAHMEHAAGEPTNETGNLTNTTNMTNATNNTAPVAENTTTNATASHNTMPVTGNPVVLLLGVSALAGGYALLRKKD